jgi:hypothetical protein
MLVKLRKIRSCKKRCGQTEKDVPKQFRFTGVAIAPDRNSKTFDMQPKWSR